MPSVHRRSSFSRSDSTAGVEPVTEGNQRGEVRSDVQGNGEGTATQGNKQVTEPVGNSEQLENGGQNALQNGTNELNLQQNDTDNEQRKVGGVSESGDAIATLYDAASYSGRGNGAATQAGQSGGKKQSLLGALVQRAKENSSWIDDAQTLTGTHITSGGENDVFLSKDGKNVIKINDFSYLPEDSENFNDFINRVQTHNELFPDVSLTIIGYTLNSEGKVSVVLKQPFVEAVREATDAEIDAFLEDMGFYTDITGNWTDGNVVIADAKPNNVLVDKNGVLSFIDVIPYDERKEGKMMRIPRDLNKGKKTSSNAGNSTETAPEWLNKVPDEDNAPYTIAPAQYTTKKGKVLDMFLVKFAGTLTKEQQRATKELAKADKGWYDREQGGFMMRSEESAKRLAEYVVDAQAEVTLEKVSMDDVKAVNDGDILFTEPQPQQPAVENREDEYRPVWQYSIHIDKDGYTTISRDDVRSGYPIGDARFRYSTDSPEEMLDILRNPLNGMQEALEAVGVTLENKIKTRELDRKSKEQAPTAETNPSGNSLVTDERYAELRERMRKKLGGQMNIGIDPEILAIGTEMAVYHLEKGARKFTEYAKAMIADLGDAIRPYLKAFYNGARNLPEVESSNIATDMTSYDEVQSFDVANFDKQGIDAFATAETVAREAEVEQEKENLAKKGVNVDDIVRQTEQAQSAIAAIQERIDNLKEFQQELTERFRKENEAKEKLQGDVLATYLKERKAENNSGFYKIRPKEEKLYRTSEEEDDTLYRSDDATKNRIEALFNQAISGEFKGKPISIGTLTDEGKAYLEQISGVAFKDKVDFVLNPSDLVHIYKGHFGNNETDERSIPLDIEDIRSIADVVSFPDRIIYAKENAGEKRKMFFFLKEADNGAYNLLEIYADKKGNLTAKTFYKTKEGVSQRAITLSKSLHTTSETAGATLNDGAKIPQMFETTSVEDNYSRSGSGPLTAREVVMESDPYSKVLGKPRYTGKKLSDYVAKQRARCATPKLITWRTMVCEAYFRPCITQKHRKNSVLLLWSIRESNSSPFDCQSNALAR